MTSRDVLQYTCPECGRHHRVNSEWLTQEMPRCSVCGASVSAQQKSLRSRIQDSFSFFRGIEFIIEIENCWDIAVSDEEACRLLSADSICEFVVSAMEAKGRPSNSEDVWSELRKFALTKLRVQEIRPDTDLLEPFRMAIQRDQFFI